MAKVVAKKAKKTGPFLAAAVFCERVMEEKDNVVSLIRVVDILKVQKSAELTTILNEKQMGMIASPIMAVLAFKSGDAKGEYDLKVIPVSPSGKRLKAMTAKVTFLGGEFGVNVRAVVPAPILEEGLYWYEVRLNGKLFTRMPLRIVHEDQPVSNDEQAEPSPPSEATK